MLEARSIALERKQEKVGLGGLSILAMWAASVVLMGAVLTSFHQPFSGPAGEILALTPSPGGGQWRMLHVLSASCGCSQRVMRHLLTRRPFPDVTEQVLLVDGEGADPQASSELIVRLGEQGFGVTRIAAKNIPAGTGLRGVPLLVVASPEDKIAYLGGYGSRGDEDGAVLRKVRAGAKVEALPVLGCAVGSRIQRQADPFGLKY